MVDTMRAQRFYADSKTIAVEDVPIPEPGPGEVLVKIAFCGICHSDLSLLNGTFPAMRPVVRNASLKISHCSSVISPCIEVTPYSSQTFVTALLPEIS